MNFYHYFLIFSDFMLSSERFDIFITPFMYCIDIAILGPLLEFRSKKNLKMIKDPPAGVTQLFFRFHAFTHWEENWPFHAILHKLDFTKSSRKN